MNHSRFLLGTVNCVSTTPRGSETQHIIIIIIIIIIITRETGNNNI